MKWEYDRKEIEFKSISEELVELNNLGLAGWEIINYEEIRPKKFGDKFKSIVLLKRLKPACNECHEDQT